MKKLFAILTICVFSAAAFAQQDTLKITAGSEQIAVPVSNTNELSNEDYNRIIKALSEATQRVSKANKNAVAKVNESEKSGEITPEEAAEARAKIADRTSETMNALGEQIEKYATAYANSAMKNSANAENFEEEWEANAKAYEEENPPVEIEKEETATVVVTDDGIHVETDSEFDGDDIKEAREKYKRNKTTGYFSWHFGWNNFFDAEGIATNDGPLLPNGATQETELDFWPSMVWGFGFGGKTRLGAGKFYVKYGAEFNWHHFRMKGNTLIVKNQLPVPAGFDGVYFQNDPTQNYSKSSFRIAYVDVPVMFEFDASKPGRSNGFSLGVGGYAGLRLNSHTKTIYSDFNGDQSKQHTKNSFYTNGYRYGVMGQIGIGTFKVTAKYDLNNLFQEDKNTPDYQIASLTLGWVFP